MASGFNSKEVIDFRNFEPVPGKGLMNERSKTHRNKINSNGFEEKIRKTPSEIHLNKVSCI